MMRVKCSQNFLPRDVLPSCLIALLHRCGIVYLTSNVIHLKSKRLSWLSIRLAWIFAWNCNGKAVQVIWHILNSCLQNASRQDRTFTLQVTIFHFLKSHKFSLSEHFSNSNLLNSSHLTLFLWLLSRKKQHNAINVAVFSDSVSLLLLLERPDYKFPFSCLLKIHQMILL